MPLPPPPRTGAAVDIVIDSDLAWKIVDDVNRLRGDLANVAAVNGVTVELVSRIMCGSSWLAAAEVSKQELIDMRVRIAAGESLDTIAASYGLPELVVRFVADRSAAAARKLARRRSKATP